METEVEVVVISQSVACIVSFCEFLSVLKSS
jgi:hypothetical protein